MKGRQRLGADVKEAVHRSAIYIVIPHPYNHSRTYRKMERVFVTVTQGITVGSIFVPTAAHRPITRTLPHPITLPAQFLSCAPQLRYLQARGVHIRLSLT